MGDDAISVTSFSCSASDGTNLDTCGSAVHTSKDACSDTGDALGGGVCSAVDYSCNGNTLVTSKSQYTDTCGGSDDQPVVKFGVCTANDGTAADHCGTKKTAKLDSCSDTGGKFGGGSCNATNWQCAKGQLSSTTSDGTDICVGADDITVKFWSCSTASGSVTDTCTAKKLPLHDKCKDTGSAAGGGSCSAVNWYCAGGTKAKHTATKGNDLCLGDDSVSVTAFACSASDGTNPDTCTSETNTSDDACTDSGDGLGGGSCSAIDYACDGNTIVVAKSSHTDACGGTPDQPSVSFGVCVANDGSAADHCGTETTEKADSCSQDGGELGGGSCSATDWDCAGGLLSQLGSQGVDTCGGDTDNPNTTFWSCNSSDGSAADQCVSALTERSDSCTDTGDGFGGGSCGATDWDCDAGLLSESTSSGVDVCGGDDDNPSVNYFSCTASDGTGADLCIVDETVRSDACSDTGTPSGGGVCSATNWICEEAVLSSTSSNGVDTCGDGSSSQVDYYVCTSADGSSGDTCTAVPDTTAPDLTCPETIVADCTRFEGVFVPGVTASTGDICDNAVDATNDYNSGGLEASDTYPIGVTEVVFTAVDDAGNTTTCTTTVEVLWTPWSFAVYAGTGFAKLYDSAVVNGEVFSPHKVELHKDATVEGSTFSLGSTKVHKDASISDGMYANGTVHNDGTATFAGFVPAGVPFPPALDTSSYDALITQAAAEPKGNVKISSLDLAGGVVLVDGKFDLKKGGTLTGPGTLVATGDITIGDDSTIGDGVNLVSGKKLTVGRDITVGAGGLLYGTDTVRIGDDTVVTGSHIVSADDVDIDKGASVTGLVFGVDDIKINDGASVVGAVISLDKVEIKKSATVAHECSALTDLPPGLGDGPKCDGPPAADGDSDSGSKSNSKSGSSSSSKSGSASATDWPPSCDDANPCTADLCEPDVGCSSTPADGAPCSDGDACTSDDSCLAGACAAGPPTTCQDGYACVPDTGCEKLDDESDSGSSSSSSSKSASKSQGKGKKKGKK